MSPYTSWRARADGSALDTVEVRDVHLDDPLVTALFEELAPPDAVPRAERAGKDFAEPDGGLILVLNGGLPLAGGGFRRASGGLRRAAGSVVPGRATAAAELTPVWTHPAFPRDGWVATVLSELERRAHAAGYGRLAYTPPADRGAELARYLTAGFAPGTGDDDRVVLEKVLRHSAPPTPRIAPERD